MLQAVDDVYYLERACEVVVKARSMDAEINIVSDKAAKAFMDDFVANGMVSIRGPKLAMACKYASAWSVSAFYFSLFLLCLMCLVG